MKIKWPVTKLRNHTNKIGSGVTPKGGQAVYKNTGIPLIRSQNVLNNKLVLSDVALIDAIQHNKMSGSKVKPNDVLLNITGASIGRSCVVPSELTDANVNQHVCIIRLKGSMNPTFLSTYLNSWFCQKQIWSFQGGGSREGLNFKQIGGFDIPLPPLPEQRAIADLLATWDEAIDKTEKLIEAKEKRFRGFEQKLITQSVLINSWRKIKLGDVGNTFTGITGKSKNDFGTGKPYITYLNVFQNSRININQIDYVQIETSEKQNRVQKGDFFFTTSSETPNEVGMTSVLLDDMEECYLNSFCFGWRPEIDLVNNNFLQYYFRNCIFRKQVYRLSQGATRFNLSKIELMKTFIYYPGIETQNQISGILSKINDEISILKIVLEKYKIQKRGLMQQLLTGVWRAK